MRLPFVTISKLGMNRNLKKRLLESARHRHVCGQASSGWTPFCFQRSELGGLGNLYCTRCTSLLAALPCLPALNSSSSALLGHCHLLMAGGGVFRFASQTASVQGTYAVLILIPLDHTEVEAKKVPSTPSRVPVNIPVAEFSLPSDISGSKKKGREKNPANWQKQTCCQMHAKESI